MKIDETSLQIINSASILFERYGARKTTMEDIAREVGKGKSTLYYYFKSKEEVFEQVLHHEFHNFRKSVMLSAGALIMAKFIKEIFSQIHQYKNLKKSLLNEVDGKSKQTALVLRDEFITWELAQIKSIMLAGVKEGVFRGMTQNELEINSKAISIAMTGLKMILLNEENLLEVNNKIDNLLALLFNGISGANG